MIHTDFIKHNRNNTNIMVVYYCIRFLAKHLGTESIFEQNFFFFLWAHNHCSAFCPGVAPTQTAAVNTQTWQTRKKMDKYVINHEIFEPEGQRSCHPFISCYFIPSTLLPLNLTLFPAFSSLHSFTPAILLSFLPFLTSLWSTGGGFLAPSLYLQGCSLYTY